MQKDKYIPAIYRENIFKINYDKLYKKGIRLLLFDLDNTITIVKENRISLETRELFKQLKKHFQIIIVSNNFGKRVKKMAQVLDADYVFLTVKPLTWKIKRKLKNYSYNNEQVCIIGDQLISDVSLGNKLKFLTILVDPLSNEDLKITKINRYLERIIFRKINKTNGKFKRGNYYE